MSDYGVEVGVHEGDDFVFWAGVQLMVTLLLLLLTFVDGTDVVSCDGYVPGSPSSP
jgi:hypothetical protein